MQAKRLHLHLLLVIALVGLHGSAFASATATLYSDDRGVTWSTDYSGDWGDAAPPAIVPGAGSYTNNVTDPFKDDPQWVAESLVVTWNWQWDWQDTTPNPLDTFKVLTSDDNGATYSVLTPTATGTDTSTGNSWAKMDDAPVPDAWRLIWWEGQGTKPAYRLPTGVNRISVSYTWDPTPAPEVPASALMLAPVVLGGIVTRFRRGAARVTKGGA